MNSLFGIKAAERYYYGGSDLVLVTDSTGDVLSRYLFGPGADGNDQALAADAGPAGVGGPNAAGPSSVRWYVNDDNGSVTDVLGADGAEVDHLTYDSYGNIVAQSAPAEQPRFGFQGMEIDQAAGAADGSNGTATGTNTEMYYDQARFYDPGTGRFLNQDPTGYGAGDPNVYRFVGNNPTGTTDPSGMDPNLGGQSSSSGFGDVASYNSTSDWYTSQSQSLSNSLSNLGSPTQAAYADAVKTTLAAGGTNFDSLFTTGGWNGNQTPSQYYTPQQQLALLFAARNSSLNDEISGLNATQAQLISQIANAPINSIFSALTTLLGLNSSISHAQNQLPIVQNTITALVKEQAALQNQYSGYGLDNVTITNPGGQHLGPVMYGSISSATGLTQVTALANTMTTGGNSVGGLQSPDWDPITLGFTMGASLLSSLASSSSIAAESDLAGGTFSTSSGSFSVPSGSSQFSIGELPAANNIAIETPVDLTIRGQSINYQPHLLPTSDLTLVDPTTLRGTQLSEFLGDVQTNGIKSPLQYVTIDNSKYVVVGSNRLRAAVQFGISEVPAQEVTLPFRGYGTIDDVLNDASQARMGFGKYGKGR